MIVAVPVEIGDNEIQPENMNIKLKKNITFENLNKMILTFEYTITNIPSNEFPIVFGMHWYYHPNR